MDLGWDWQTAIVLALAIVTLVVLVDVVRTCLFIYSNSRERTRLHEETMASLRAQTERFNRSNGAPAE